MEKLIKLLNEWYQERYKTNPHFNKFKDYWGNDYWYFIWDDKLMVETEVWTKKYWFIKWLVDNNKIKLEELKWHFMDLWELAWNTEFILMMLSIQDNPIEFLISILK